MDDERAFIGRAALERQLAAGLRNKLVGLVLEARGVLRHGQAVTTPAGAGVITSGSFSPTLQRAIALARVPAATGGDCTVEVRGKALPARVVRPPFARNGKVCEGIL
jgi:aminomethyltransferase